MTRLSKLFSSAEKEKAALAEAERNGRPSHSDSPPPSYDRPPPDFDPEDTIDPPDLTAGFKNLSLSNATQYGFPAPEQCIAHLKVLEAFYRLRQAVGTQYSLFGIDNRVVTESRVPANDETPALLAKLAEKRWGIFVQRAVDRFETWWAAVTPNSRMISRADFEKAGMQEQLLAPEHAEAPPLRIDASNIPPLDVLMVWHAYMLNPRAYLEDCLRYGRMSLWHTDMPWQAASDSINAETFSLEASEAAQKNFTSITNFPWDNLAREYQKILRCPNCSKECQVKWTSYSAEGVDDNAYTHKKLAEAIDQMLGTGRGFCDKGFSALCPNCRTSLDHDRLKAGKFRNDVKRLLSDNVPMGGTMLGTEDMPWRAFGVKERFMEYSFCTPNDMLASGDPRSSSCLGHCILKNQNLTGSFAATDTMAGIRDLIQLSMLDRKWLRQVRNSLSSNLVRQEKIAIRRLMSRYWENSSPFALDLVGAVIRQGSFVEKMHNIDWLHSPALPSTMRRLLVKYERFIIIIAQYKGRMAVPTLDVDLAWHTHQLAPSRYMAYSVRAADTFIDHDDKVAETKLNDAFAWTSDTYQRRWSEPYSECTCWYCEAVRESHTSGLSRLFNSANTRAAEQLQQHAEQDPRKSVHISAHNAVRPSDDTNNYQVNAAIKADALDRAYQKACDRARRKGKPVPRRDDYYYSDAWGYPVYIPAYAPYVGYVPYCPAFYPVNPGCMALGAGSVGNCCSGTCGGGVAAGGCASGAAGGCAGGAAGGCGGGGGGGGGGCGGGGGGGGGGGCGGGGGGGGGGC